MSKRPRIKQADGSLLDLPLDAETIKGKTLEEIALKAEIPTKTSQLTNDSNFATTSQLFSKDYNDLTNKPTIPTKLSQLEQDVELGISEDRVVEIVEENKVTKTSELEYDSKYVNNQELTNAIDKFDEEKLKPEIQEVQDSIPTKMSELEQDVEFGVSEEDVMNIVKNNAESTTTLSVGTSTTFNPESDEQIPTSKAVAEMVTDAVDNFKVDEFEPAINNLRDDIPTKTSQLTNNSGFITNAVNNLTNYYLKSETYTKSEVQQLLSTISGLKLEVVTNLPTTNISSNTIYLKPLDSAKENNIYEEYIYIKSKWETIGTTAVDLSNYALKTDIPTKTSQLTNDSGFLTEHQDISGKADKTELDNYIPYTTGTGNSAKNINWTTQLNDFQFDIKSTKPSIKFIGDRVGSATITPNKIELNGNSESGTASILLDGKPVALQENIPTKISQLEQDVELGVSEEDVINIISQYISSNFENGDEGSY